MSDVSEDCIDDNLRALAEFKKAIKRDKKLPQNINDILLQRYLNVFDDNDINKSLALLKFNLSLRQSAPHIFTSRDVFSAETQKAAKVFQLCPLPRLLTPQNYKVTIIRFANENASQFDYVETVKMALMALDANFTVHDNCPSKFSTGECFILDAKGISFRHFLKVASNIKTVRVYMKYLQEAAPFNIRQMHVCNCSSIFDKVFTLIRPLLNKEILDAMHFHPNGLESLHRFVPKELLPREYDGEMESINYIHRKFWKMVESKNEYLIDESNWAVTD